MPHETLPVTVILVAAIHGAHGVTLRGLHVLLEQLLKGGKKIRKLRKGRTGLYLLLKRLGDDNLYLKEVSDAVVLSEGARPLHWLPAEITPEP